MGLLFHLTALEQRGRNHLLFSLSLLQAMPLYKITTQQILSSALDLTGRIGYLSGQLMPFVISVSMLNVFFWISCPPFKRPAHKKIDNLYFSILLHHSLKPDSCLMSYRRQEIEPWNQWGGQQWNVPCFPLIITSLFLCLFIVGGIQLLLGSWRRLFCSLNEGEQFLMDARLLVEEDFLAKGFYGNTLRPMWLGVIYGSHTLSGIRGRLCHLRWSAWKVSQLKRRAVMVHSFRGGWTRFDSLFEREWKFWFSSKGLIVWVALRCTAMNCSTHFINIRYDILWFSWACRV